MRRHKNLLLLFLTLNVLTYPLVLGKIKSNGLNIQWRLHFVLTNFEITMLSLLTFQIFIAQDYWISKKKLGLFYNELIWTFPWEYITLAIILIFIKNCLNEYYNIM